MARRKSSTSFKIGIIMFLIGFLMVYNSLAQLTGLRSYVDSSFLGYSTIIVYGFGYLFLFIGTIILGAHFKAWLERSTGTRF